MQERFNKDLEEIKKSQYIMNNAISEIKNTLEAAPAQGNQSLSRELRASALCPGLDREARGAAIYGVLTSKATLWVKAQHEGALPPPCIVRKDPRVPHTARRGA